MRYLFSSVLILSLFLPRVLQAQNRWELGLFGGISNYIGDLAPDPVFSESHPAVGIAVKRNANPYVSYTLNLNYGTISGNDSNYAYLAPRGLKFESGIIELSAQVEFNFFRFGTAEMHRSKRFSPYIFTGLSYFHFDPMASYNGTSYHLQLETTEGQGLPDKPAPYKLWQLAFPMGGGFKFNISDRLNLLIFAGYRATFTSYLDDVGGNYISYSFLNSEKGSVAAYFSDPTHNGYPGKQRGNPDKYDWYIFSGITLSFILPGPICPDFSR